MFERISLELTNQCSKGCSFCYNASRPQGQTRWDETEVVEFVEDCACHGVRAVSFGGGEPLEFDGVFDVLASLDGMLFRSVTTNGLLLDNGALKPLIDSNPDKVHVSLHFPNSQAEVSRVIRHVLTLEDHGVTAGVNLLVARSQLDHVSGAAKALAAAGIENDQIVYLPMRGQDTPTPRELAGITASCSFQSMSCLPSCAPSQRFCSIRWDKSVAWCSYTAARRPLTELSHRGLCEAMHGIGLTPCGGSFVPSPFEPVVEPTVVVMSDTISSKHVDYPAAHSMDTQWFAADKNGHVAVLDSGEPGVVPKTFVRTAGYEDVFYDVLDLLLESDSESEVRFDLHDLFERGPGQIYQLNDFHDPPDTPIADRLATVAALIDEDAPSPKPQGFFATLLAWAQAPLRPKHYPRTAYVVCWLRDESVMTRLPDRSKLLPTVDHVAAWVPGCSVESLRQLYEEGLVLAVLMEESYPPPHRFGFYMYNNEDYDSGPYDRVVAPVRPLHIDQLPSDLRELCGRIRFSSIAFHETLKFQPAEYMSCVGWGDGWVDLEGNAHLFEADE